MKTKRVEFYSIPGCSQCRNALMDLKPILKEKKIPYKLIKNDFDQDLYPRTCIINEINGKEETTCITGWDKSYIDDLHGLIS